MQVAFLLEQKADQDEAREHADSRVVLGKLHINWRGAMGDRGTLSTGWLHGRQK